MIVLFLILYGLMARSMKVCKGGIYEDYLSKENTQSIKGVFIIIVFMSHVRGYAEYSAISDQFVISILDYLGQFMVAMFLFCSGYGVFESFKRKGDQYINSFPKNRIRNTYFDFVIALILWLIFDLVTQTKYSLRTIVLSFTGWDNIGNSSWYMFVIFTLYIITFVCFKFFKSKPIIAITAVVIFSLIYIYIIRQVRPSHWSNTCLCYSFGLLWSYFGEYINRFLKHIKTYRYYILLCPLFVVYNFLFDLRYSRLMAFNIASITFCLLIIVVMMKISFKSKILLWCGNNLFWIYILQRIPMAFFYQIGINEYNRYLYLFLCVTFTGILTQFVSTKSEILKRKIWKI